MAILKKSEIKKTKTQIDLTGPDGNVFFLLGTAVNLAKQIGLDPEQIQNEMKSSDYDNAVNVFDKYFGDYVDLIK